MLREATLKSILHTEMRLRGIPLLSRLPRCLLDDARRFARGRLVLEPNHRRELRFHDLGNEKHHVDPRLGDGRGDGVSESRLVVALDEQRGNGGSGQAGLAAAAVDFFPETGHTSTIALPPAPW